MSRFECERQGFIRAYTRILVSSWSDESYLNRLITNPRDVLSQEGLEIPDSVAVRVERTGALVLDGPSSEAALDQQVSRWLDAEEQGELLLYIPDAP